MVEVEEIMDDEEIKSPTASELADQLWEKIQSRLYLPNLRVRIIYINTINPHLAAPFVQICYDNLAGADYRSIWHKLPVRISADVWNETIDNLKLKFEKANKSEKLYTTELVEMYDTLEKYKTLTHIGEHYDYGD